MMLRHKRFDVRVTRMGPVRVEVYWRADESGCGPCMSVYIGKKERLRCDLFDPAHVHYGTVHGAPRNYYPEGLSREEYIALAIEDLHTHAAKAWRAAGWAAEQLLQVSGPSVPMPPVKQQKPPPTKLPHGQRARQGVR